MPKRIRFKFRSSFSTEPTSPVYVPQSDVETLIDAMQKSEVDDWTLAQFCEALHSFTNPDAQSNGSRYQARAAKRPFNMINNFAEEMMVLGD